jgi:4-hydroxy-tetrahydrodipicolinate synthase
MALLDETARGVYVIAVTPFAEDGSLDVSSIGRMVDFYEEAGVDGLTLLGQMGEAAKLSADESIFVVERVLRRLDGRLPVVVGVSAPELGPMKELAKAVTGAGAAGVMVAPVRGLRSAEEIVSYFHSVADALGDTPWVLQDYPVTTGVVIPPELVDRIVREIATCVMLKHEDWPGLNKITALRISSDRGDTRRIAILCGNGGLFLPEELSRGADGAMTGFCFPEMMVAVVREHAAGNRSAARDIFDAYLPLVRYEQQQGLGLACRKYVLWRRGVLASPALRQPGPTLTSEDIADIESLLERQAVRLEALNA